jgi:hypothetical protein
MRSRCSAGPASTSARPLLGRPSVVPIWPSSRRRDSHLNTAPMNDILKVVFSRTLRDASRPETTVARGDTRYPRCIKPSRGGLLPINGLQLYCEAYGELGATEVMPLLFIPGAFQSTDSMKQWVEAFVRAVRRRRCGVAARLGGRACRRDGLFAVRRSRVAAGAASPQVVSKFVTLSATYCQDGWYPSVSRGLEGFVWRLIRGHGSR